MQEDPATITVEQPADTAVVDAVEQPQDDKPNNPDGFSKALTTEREARKAAEARVKELEAAEEERRKATLSETERAIEEAKESTRREVEGKYARDLLEAKAAAKAVMFHDPALAVQLAALPDNATDADIDEAFAALAQARPYLLKTAPVPSLPLGPRGQDGSSGPSLTGDDWLRRQVMERTGM